MKHVTLAALLLSTVPADACHHYSIWKNPWPQRCPGVHVHTAQKEAPPQIAPNIKEEAPPIEFIMPLPPLDTGFPPECDSELCQRLKGIGLLRQLHGTN